MNGSNNAWWFLSPQLKLTDCWLFLFLSSLWKQSRNYLFVFSRCLLPHMPIHFPRHTFAIKSCSHIWNILFVTFLCSFLLLYSTLAHSSTSTNSPPSAFFFFTLPFFPLSLFSFFLLCTIEFFLYVAGSWSWLITGNHVAIKGLTGMIPLIH